MHEETGLPEQMHFLDELDKIVESPSACEKLSNQIHEFKNVALLGQFIRPDYEGALVKGETEGEWLFRDPDHISHAKEELTRETLETIAIYKKTATRDTFARAVGKLTALAELELLSPSELARTQRLHAAGEIKTIGIQKEQIQSAVAILSGHSDEFASGQGKNAINMPIAITWRALTGSQVHYYVRDDESKVRDEHTVKKLTDHFGLNIEVLHKPVEQTEDYASLQKLILLRSAVAHSQPKYHEYLASIQGEINKKAEELTTRRFEQKALELARPKTPPHIVIGEASEFQHNFISERTPRIWSAKNECAIMDEGDEEYEGGSPKIISGSELDTLSAFLPQWISCTAANEILTAMDKEGLITRSPQNEIMFNAEDGTDTESIFEDQLAEKLHEIKNGELLPEDSMAHLAKRLSEDIAPMLIKLGITNFQADAKLSRSLIQTYAKTLPEKDKEEWNELVAGMQYAWKQTADLVKGTHFTTDEKGASIINPLNGWILPGHRYSGIVHTMLEARNSIASLTVQNEASASTGIYAFLESAYGRKTNNGTKFRCDAVLVTGTGAHLAKDIKHFLRKDLIVSPQWIGKPIETPDIDIYTNQKGALIHLNRMLEQYKEKSTPLLIVCENDRELATLQEHINNWKFENHISTAPVQLITSKTKRNESSEVFAHAGEKNAITCANMRSGRMVHIPVSDDINAKGGLHVLIWGTLSTNAALRQAIARTFRAGQNGQLTWIVYKSDGIAALDQDPMVKRRVSLEDKVANLNTSSALSYEGSVVEQIHAEHTESLRNSRMITYLDNALKSEIYSRIYELASRFYITQNPTSLKMEKIASDEYISETVRNAFGSFIIRVSDDLAQRIRSQHSIKNFDEVIGAISKEVPQIRQYIEDLGAEPELITNFLQIPNIHGIHTSIAKLNQATIGNSPFARVPAYKNVDQDIHDIRTNGTTHVVAHKSGLEKQMYYRFSGYPNLTMLISYSDLDTRNFKTKSTKSDTTYNIAFIRHEGNVIHEIAPLTVTLNGVGDHGNSLLKRTEAMRQIKSPMWNLFTQHLEIPGSTFTKIIDDLQQQNFFSRQPAPDTKTEQSTIKIASFQPIQPLPPQTLGIPFDPNKFNHLNPMVSVSQPREKSE